MGKFIFAMMNEQTFNQTGTGGLLLPKALTFSLKSPQRHVLRKIQLRIWDFFSLLPLWQLLCSKCFIICVFPMKKSKVALEAQKNNPCHDFHILYGSAELFGYRTWSSDLLGLIFLMPWDNFHVFSVTVLYIPKYPNSQIIPLFSSE